MKARKTFSDDGVGGRGEKQTASADCTHTEITGFTSLNWLNFFNNIYPWLALHFELDLALGSQDELEELEQKNGNYT